MACNSIYLCKSGLGCVLTLEKAMRCVFLQPRAHGTERLIYVIPLVLSKDIMLV